MRQIIAVGKNKKEVKKVQELLDDGMGDLMADIVAWCMYDFMIYDRLQGDYSTELQLNLKEQGFI